MAIVVVINSEYNVTWYLKFKDKQEGNSIRMSIVPAAQMGIGTSANFTCGEG